jgi:hypothetical protein
MTQNKTKNDKREQCDTKHNALKIHLTRKKITPYRTLFLQPTRQRVLHTICSIYHKSRGLRACLCSRMRQLNCAGWISDKGLC